MKLSLRQYAGLRTVESGGTSSLPRLRHISLVDDVIYGANGVAGIMQL